MRCRWFAFFSLFFFQSVFAQPGTFPGFFERQLQAYNKQLTQATNDREKIGVLGEMAEYFYTYRLEKEGDSVLQKQQTLTQLSQDRDLMLSALFSNAVTNIYPWTETEVFDRTLRFINGGLQYARKLERKDYVALAYIRMANVLRKRGQLNEALAKATQAFSALEGVKADSVRVVLNLELGDIHLERRDAVQAFQNFSNAYEVAYANRNVSLQSQAFHRFFSLYQYTLKNPERAQENLYKSLTLNKAAGHTEGLLADYKDLARSTDNRLFIDSLLALSTTFQKQSFIGAESYRLNAKNMMLAYYMVVSANSQAAINYLKENEDLNFFIHNSGIPVYYLTLGNIYFYARQYDSSLHYYKLAEPELSRAFEQGTKASVYKSIAKSYQNLNQPENAIAYFQKSLTFNRGDADVLQNLSKLYAEVSDFENAYAYNKLYDQQIDTIQRLNNQRELDLLEVEQANRLRQKELDEIAAEHLRRNNLQYTGISFGIAFLFIAMLVFGMFPVSKLAIKMLNFFSFICLFEFIILLIDTWLHHATHGEPLKIWLAKIFIIALLLPLHHSLEHVGMKFLDSQKLIRLRQRFRMRKFWKPSKKTLASLEKNLEESTLV